MKTQLTERSECKLLSEFTLDILQADLPIQNVKGSIRTFKKCYKGDDLTAFYNAVRSVLIE